jgi:hypothetical protein
MKKRDDRHSDRRKEIEIIAFIIRKQAFHIHPLDFLLKEIRLVQEKNYRTFLKPTRIHNFFKQCNRLMHSIHRGILNEILIILTHGNEKNDRRNTLEAMNPFSSLASLATNINHAEVKLSDGEANFVNARRLCANAQDIIDSGDIFRI